MHGYIRKLLVAVVGVSSLAWHVASHAQDARSLAVGAAVPNGALKIGARTYTLPPGEWVLAARHVRNVRLNDVSTGSEVIETSVARIADGKLRALIVFIGPTAPTHTPSWREDIGCKPRSFILLDVGSTPTHPECIAVQVFNAVPAKLDGAEVYAQTSAFLTERSVTSPTPVLRIGAIKYQGDEYLRVTVFADPALFGLSGDETRALKAAPPPMEQWARALRATVGQAMGSIAGTHALPALPAQP